VVHNIVDKYADRLRLFCGDGCFGHQSQIVKMPANSEYGGGRRAELETARSPAVVQPKFTMIAPSPQIT
jgi:hypothetical protein